MKLLVIGAGGREHALAWRLAKTPGLQKVFVAPGNAGTASERELENVNLTDPEALADFASRLRTSRHEPSEMPQLSSVMRTAGPSRFLPMASALAQSFCSTPTCGVLRAA